VLPSDKKSASFTQNNRRLQKNNQVINSASIDVLNKPGVSSGKRRFDNQEAQAYGEVQL
jgi:hypothetical protein